MLTKKRFTIQDWTVDVRESRHAGPAIILVHGIGVSGTYFLPLADELARDHHVLVLDLPGYGKTTKPPQPLTIPQLARVVEQISKIYALNRPVLVGQSMGCQIVTELATQSPGRYNRIILIGPTVNRAERARFMQALRLAQDTFLEPLKLSKIIFSDYVRMGMRRYWQTSSFMMAHRIERHLKKYTGHTLIVRGESDKISPATWCHYLAEEAAQSGTYAEIPGAAHVAQYTKPKELGAVCRAFLQK